LKALGELIAGLQTSEETVARARAFAVACGKGMQIDTQAAALKLNVCFHLRGDRVEGCAGFRVQCSIDAVLERGVWFLLSALPDYTDRACNSQAIMHLERGIATRDDIDKTLRLGMGHPMGPLTLGEFSVPAYELSLIC
jgi:3-hydroxybutyryl-CoA dehydrogenase